MGADNENLVVQILAGVTGKDGSEVTLTTADLFLTELLKYCTDAAEIIVGATMNEMHMHDFCRLLTIDYYKLISFLMQR